MATTTVVLRGQPPPLGAHQKATLSWGNGLFKLTVPVLTALGFDQVEGVNWVELDRPGRLPLTVFGGEKLARATLELQVVDPTNPNLSVQRTLFNLQTLSKHFRSAVLVTFGSTHRYSTTGYWLIDSMAITPVRRRHGDNEITEAEISIELKTAMLPALVKT